MNSKKERLSAILDIIKKNTVSSQEELLSFLNKGKFNITQATLSRDIKQLKIIKSTNVEGSYIYTLPGWNKQVDNNSEPYSNEFLSQGFVSIEFSGNLAVIKTRAGYAMGIASDIDNRATHEILGTIAGDDTILVIPREGILRKDIIQSLSVIIPNIKF